MSWVLSGCFACMSSLHAPRCCLGVDCADPHFMETKAQGCYITLSRHTASTWWGWCRNPGSLAPESMFLINHHSRAERSQGLGLGHSCGRCQNVTMRNADPGASLLCLSPFSSYSQHTYWVPGIVSLATYSGQGRHSPCSRGVYS